METERKLIRNGYVDKPPLAGTRIAIADQSEMDDLLLSKVVEELNEFNDAIDSGVTLDIAMEAADAIETIYARATLYGVSPEQIEAERIKKKELLGGFENRAVIIYENN